MMHHDDEQRELRYMVEDIDQKGSGLTDWEVKFISGIIDRDVKTFTPKMKAQIERMHTKLLS